MAFNEFVAVLDHWLDSDSITPLDCWIDAANARLVSVEGGVRCSLDVLDPYEASAPQRLHNILEQGAASVACHCEGALCLDPDSQSLALVHWLAAPVTTDQLLALLQSLANQRAAMLSLMSKALLEPGAAPSRSGSPAWHPGV